MARRKTRRGFTLIELMVVIVILGIIGTIAFVSVMGEPDKARWQKASTEMGEIRKTLDRWALSHDGEYPETLEEISSDFPGGKVPIDPFSKEPYTYNRTETGFLLECLGHDKTESDSEIPDRDIRFNERGMLAAE